MFTLVPVIGTPFNLSTIEKCTFGKVMRFGKQQSARMSTSYKKGATEYAVQKGKRLHRCTYSRTTYKFYIKVYIYLYYG